MGFKLVLKENKKKKVPIRLFTHPKYVGADVDYDYTESLPTTKIPVDKLVYWEKWKVNTDFFKEDVAKMIKLLKSGKKLPPIIVTETGFFKKKYLIIDGHHRAVAFKEMGEKEIEAKIVPKDKVRKQGGVPTLDEDQIKFMMSLPNIGD